MDILRMKDAIKVETELWKAITKEKRNYLEPEESKRVDSVVKEILGDIPINDAKEMVEIFDFVNEPPDKYFAYLNMEGNKVTTWTGGVLANVGYKKEMVSNFGDKRIYFRAFGINGVKYSAVCYGGNGCYVRMKRIKG